MDDSSLWSADEQLSRLAELTASTTDPAKDLPLRRDVRSLGTLLGRVLVEQCGDSLLGVVEELRRIFIQHREQPRPQDRIPDFRDLDFKHPDLNDLHFKDPLLTQARNIVSGLTVDEAHRVTKAFAIYFELTKIGRASCRERV